MTARDNPFETSRVESLIPFDPAWLDTSWEAILDRYEELEYKGAIVGPHGTGKTTFLDQFVGKLETKSGLLVCRLFLNEDKRHLTPQEKMFLTNCPNHGSIILVLDGEEQFSFLDRQEFSRLAYGFGGVLVTRHRPSRNYPTLLQTRSTPEMLIKFVHQLMPDFPGDESLLRSYFDDTEGNIRESLRKAYDFVASNS